MQVIPSKLIIATRMKHLSLMHTQRLLGSFISVHTQLRSSSLHGTVQCVHHRGNTGLSTVCLSTVTSPSFALNLKKYYLIAKRFLVAFNWETRWEQWYQIISFVVFENKPWLRCLQFNFRSTKSCFYWSSLQFLVNDLSVIFVKRKQRQKGKEDATEGCTKLLFFNTGSFYDGFWTHLRMSVIIFYDINKYSCKQQWGPSSQKATRIWWSSTILQSFVQLISRLYVAN